MKRGFAVLFALTVAFGLCKGASAGEYVTDANTLALYHFNAGSELVDSSVSGSTQTLNESIVNGKDLLSPVSTGKFGGGYYFDGVSNTEVGPSCTLRLNGEERSPSLLGSAGASWSDFTFEMWVKPNSAPNPHPYDSGNWIMLGEIGSTFYLYANQTASGLQPYVQFMGADGSDVWVGSPEILQSEQWGHVAVTWDTKNNIAKIWVNDVVAGSADITGKALKNDSTNPLVLGNKWGGYDSLLSGTIDEVRISNVARDFSVQQPVPEPTSLLSMALGLLGAGSMIYRRK